ncbi:MAG: 30S ribosomal protein S12 methylthiotransferase RimO [Flammeovirgaceae bacterium]|nr:30S ribosomal protein S12 methylthiotransferase RimO [Flammeovirgaceae bacterium]|tara:strand:- start:4159 stop:5466 length:1308 start_codon:yes stop_codon:yes gene_type:complete
MQTKSKEKINIVTLGCAKNIVDSEVLLTQLKGNDKKAFHQRDDINPDVVIVNTCGFIDNAKQESIDTILSYAKQKEVGEIKKLFVTGCLSQRYKENLEKDIPEVDGFYGTRDLPELLKNFQAKYRNELLGERIITTDSHYAYLKISEGCDRPCSFCAIPIMRGKHRSKSIEDLVIETKNLVKNGVREIMVIAQDSTYYGLDLYGERKLPDLLKRLSDIEGLDWIRVHYAYPSGFPLEIIKVMRDRENICNYLDIPLQHGSSEILKLMRRGITREKTDALIKDIRDINPEISIRTTLIAGHPGEKDSHFKEMYDFVERNRFDRLGVFTYSHEEGTHSHSFEDDVPETLKRKRYNQIMSLQQSISEDLNKKKVGKSFKVLIDRGDKNNYFGRTEFDSPEVDNEVIIPAKNFHLRVGEFYDVKIISASEYDLIGEVLK